MTCLSSFIDVYIVIWISRAIDALTYSLSADDAEAAERAGELRRWRFGGGAFATTRFGGG